MFSLLGFYLCLGLGEVRLLQTPHLSGSGSWWRFPAHSKANSKEILYFRCNLALSWVSCEISSSVDHSLSLGSCARQGPEGGQSMPLPSPLADAGANELGEEFLTWRHGPTEWLPQIS